MSCQTVVIKHELVNDVNVKFDKIKQYRLKGPVLITGVTEALHALLEAEEGGDKYILAT